MDQDSLLVALLELGIGGVAPFVDGEFSGGQCKIYKINFRNDNGSLAVRVPHHINVGGPNNSLIDFIKAEWDILKMLEEKGFSKGMHVQMALWHWKLPVASL